ncbi:FAD-binding protein [Neobacillus drentensis]|uniref:FAD-binding protein n=1 Tax=Neobacillus drentensis TaxID=220684 RepID=UPI00082408B7|nr:FAD-binding protein [Neobacillus drentensis]
MATKLIHDNKGVHGVVIKHHGETKEIYSKSVILSSGGFHANTEMRTRYLDTGGDRYAPEFGEGFQKLTILSEL